MLGVLCASCIANEFSTSANPRYASGFDLSMKLRFLLCCAAVAPPPGADRLSVVKDGICGAFGCCLGDPELLDAKADRECRCLRPCVGALRLYPSTNACMRYINTTRMDYIYIYT